MTRSVTKDILLDRITAASKSDSEFIALRNWLEDFYWAEVDYEFESADVELIFCRLHAHLEDDEILVDPRRPTKLKRLVESLRQDQWSYEHLILALDQEELFALRAEFRSGLIRQDLYLARIRHMSSFDFDVDLLVQMLDEVAGSWAG